MTWTFRGRTQNHQPRVHVREHAHQPAGAWLSSPLWCYPGQVFYKTDNSSSAIRATPHPRALASCRQVPNLDCGWKRTKDIQSASGLRVKCLLCKHVNLGLIPRTPCKKDGHCMFAIPEAGRLRQDNPWGLLASQTNLRVKVHAS